MRSFVRLRACALLPGPAHENLAGSSGFRTLRRHQSRSLACASVQRCLSSLEERDTAGDGFFATFDGPARAIRAGHAIVAGVRNLGLELRVGIHVGECELHDEKPSGLAVSIGARVAAQARSGEVLVTSTVRDLVAGSGFEFEERGDRELKGVPGTWRLYAAREEKVP
jgi:class 3 adenylate cyclase